MPRISNGEYRPMTPAQLDELRRMEYDRLKQRMQNSSIERPILNTQQSIESTRISTPLVSNPVAFMPYPNPVVLPPLQQLVPNTRMKPGQVDTRMNKFGGKVKKPKLPKYGPGGRVTEEELANKYAFQVEPFDKDRSDPDRVVQGYDYWYSRLQDEGLTPEEADMAVRKMSNPLQVSGSSMLTPRELSFDEVRDANTADPAEFDLYTGDPDRANIRRYRPDKNLNARKPFGYGMDEFEHGGRILTPKPLLPAKNGWKIID